MTRFARRIGGFVTVSANWSANRRGAQRVKTGRRPRMEVPQAQLVEPCYREPPVGSRFLDADFRYLAVNRRLAEANGVPLERHIGRTVHEIVPVVGAMAEKTFRQVVETRRPILDQEFSTESPTEPGQTGHYSVSWFPVEGADGRLHGVGVAVTEITEHKRLEKALRESEAALLQRNQIAMRQLGEIEALYAMVPAGVALVDPEFRFVRVNQRLADLDGMKIPDIIGRTVSEVVPKLWPRLEPIYRQVIESRQPVHGIEIRGVTEAQPGNRTVLERKL